jgi:Zn-dependent protease with chaperone function
MSGLLEVSILAGVLIAAITWVVVSLFAPRSGARARSPFGLRAWLYALLWVPPMVLLASFAPGVVAGWIEQGDHCLTHGGHHHHLCLLHPPHATGHPLTWVLPLALAIPTAFVLLRCAWRGRCQRRLARLLVETSRPSEFGANVRLLDRDEPLALTVQARTPTILLSTGLVDIVSAQTLDVVLAHERAHVARGDLRLARFDRAMAALLPRTVATGLLDQLVLAREIACDAAAVQRIGNPVAVARALVEVARLGMCAPATGVSIVSGALEARILHLLAPPAVDRRPWLVPVVLLAALLIAGAVPVHRIVEHLVTFLLH